LEKTTVNFLTDFEKDLWNKVKRKLNPFDTTLKDLVRDLIRVFVGDLDEVNPQLVKELKRILEG